MELKTLKGYEPYIEPEKILDNLHKKYKNEDWILSKEGQELIGSFKVNGRQLFKPNHE